MIDYYTITADATALHLPAASGSVDGVQPDGMVVVVIARRKAAVRMPSEREVNEFANDGFVGREVVVDRLRGLVNALADGHGGLGWVVGEPGIGKSTLVDVVVNPETVGWARVLRAAADEFSQAFALRLMADCLDIRRNADDGFRLEIADLLAGRATGVDAVRAASERMVALVQRECAHSPVVVVGDDLQWADEASLEVWHRLVQMTPQLPLLLITVCRPVPERLAVDRVRQEVDQVRGAVVIELGPLGDGAVAAMAEGILSAVPGPNLRGELARAGGNPLYVREMLDALVKTGQVRFASGVAEVVTPAGPELSSLSAAIGLRLGFLSAAARSALGAGAVLGGRFTADDLAVASGHSTPDLGEIIAEALATGVLTRSGPELTFQHALIREALYEEMPVAVRVYLHGHVARVLADADASWDRVALHLLAAPQAIEGWVLSWLAAVPTTALAASPATAADLLERARHVAMPDDPRRSLFTARLTTVLRLLRRQDDLVALGAPALATVTDPALVGEIALNLARGYRMAGRSADGDDVLKRVLDGPDPGAPWRSRLRAQLALGLVFAGHGDEAAAQAQLAIAEGERDGDPLSVGWALHALLMGAANDIDGLELIDRGLQVVVTDDPQSMDLRLLFLTNRLHLLSNLDRFAEFEAALAPAVALAESQGSPRLDAIHRSASIHFLDCGDWDRALLHLDQMSDALTPYQSVHRHGATALIAIRRGDRTTAARNIAAVQGVPYLSALDFLLVAEYLTLARALMAEADGDLTMAIKILGDWIDPRVDGNARACAIRAEVLPELVRLALGAGDRVTARTVVETIEADARTSTDANLTMRAGICRAMIEDDPDPLMSAADNLDRFGRRPEAAFALLEGAVRLAMRGDAPAARAALSRAMKIHGELEAILDMRRAQARLRPYGVRSGSRAPHRRVATGWEALTPTERTIAALAAEGRSNPDIASRLLVSPRTVDAHVTHILTKLAVRSRHDIARRVNTVVQS